MKKPVKKSSKKATRKWLTTRDSKMRQAREKLTSAKAKAKPRKSKPLTKAELILRVRALELDNERLTNLLRMTPQAPYTPGPSEMSDDDLGEQSFQIAQEFARRGRAAQKAVDEVMNGVLDSLLKKG